MMFRNQKVVAVMPAYNVAQTPRSTYQEIMEQDIVDLVIVVDDGSEHETVAIAEISCPTKYFAEAASINLSGSIKYGFGCLKTAMIFRLAKMKLMSSALFPTA